MKVESEQKHLDWATLLNAVRRHDSISALLYTCAEQSINNNNITVTYNPNQSSAKAAKITLAYDNEDESSDNSAESGRQSHNKHRGSQESSDSGNNAAVPSSDSPDSAQRQEQFLRKAGAGIQGRNRRQNHSGTILPFLKVT